MVAALPVGYIAVASCLLSVCSLLWAAGCDWLVVVVGGHLVLSYLLLVSNLARLAARFCSRRSLASVMCAVTSSS